MIRFMSVFVMPSYRLAIWCWASLCCISCVLAAAAAEPMKNSECLECHSDNTLFKTNAAGKAVSMFVDPAKLTNSAHRTNTCASCHSDLKRTHPDDNTPARPVSCAECHREQSESYGASVHGRALAAGQADAAGCTDCHGSHEILPPTSPASPLHFSRLTATCGDCHSEASADVADSVHGRAVTKGNREAATCTDCHSEHRIETLKASSSLKISEQICSKCHASERISTKYHLPADRVKTFFESYHGLAAQYGSTRAANCASCHGVHKILPSSDPRSSIHQSHLVETCGKCHPGASARFAQAKVHVNGTSGSDFGEQANFWVRRIYLVLIFGVVGFMGLHNGMAWLKKALAARRDPDRSVLRMDKSQRKQHFILLSSFIVLAVSGFALRYPEARLSWLMGGDEAIRSLIHRVAGVILLLGGVYHIGYVLGSSNGRQLVKDLWPKFQDVKDLFAYLGYLFGLRNSKPAFARFGYPHKMEYWAVVWGTIIMGVTGLLIWFKIPVTQFLPRWTVEVSTTIHFYEAILACLSIVVWHFYHVLFDPGVYPINWAWLDGKVSREWHEEEHPLDPALRTHGRKEDTEVETVTAGSASTHAPGGGTSHDPS